MGSYSFLTVLLAICGPSLAQSQRGIPVQMTWPVDNFCFRRLNETHQVGCASSYSGNVGIVHFVHDGQDAEYVTKHAPSGMYVPVIADTVISTELLDSFAASKRVAGVIISSNGTRAPEAFSADDTCPNRRSSMPRNESNCSWNDNPKNKMSAAFQRDYPFPMFLIKNMTVIANISRCFETFNKPSMLSASYDQRKCAVKLYAPMNAAVNTKTCMRRSQLATFVTHPMGFCDPIGDHNVLTILPAKASDEEPANFARSTVVLAARMDTFSMFDGLAPGADSAVTGIVSVLAAADAIARYRERNDIPALEKNILFSLFNGEAFDYIGSSRFVYDLLREKAIYGLTLKNISSLIEFNQLIPEDPKSPKWYAHVDSQQYRDSNDTKGQLDRILNDLKKDRKLFPITDGSLPPASAHSFLKADNSIPSVVITNHEGRYINPFYNSFFDDFPHRLDDLEKVAENIASVVQTTSETLLELARSTEDKSPLEVKVNITLIANLLDCYLRNYSCPLFASVVNDHSIRLLRQRPYQLYVGVTNPPSKLHLSTQLTYLLLASLTGKAVDNVTSIESCYRQTKEFPEWAFDWMRGPDPSESQPGLCIRHRAVTPMAQSPYFDSRNEKQKDNQMAYSTWTESVWEAPHLELFVQASGYCEVIALFSGLAIFIVSFAITVLLYRQADIVFEQATPVAC